MREIKIFIYILSQVKYNYEILIKILDNILNYIQINNKLVTIYIKNKINKNNLIESVKTQILEKLKNQIIISIKVIQQKMRLRKQSSTNE